MQTQTRIPLKRVYLFLLKQYRKCRIRILKLKNNNIYNVLDNENKRHNNKVVPL
jgi:hypothetical protein